MQRKNRDGSRDEVACSQLVVDFTKCMGGVDCHDQLRLHRYSVQKSMRLAKYYKSLFLGIVDMALINGYIIHKLAKV